MKPDEETSGEDRSEEGRKILFLLLVAFLLLIVVPPGLGESPYNFF